MVVSPVALFVLFLILKLANAIAWSWWWITSPLWITGALVVIVGGFLLTVGGSAYLLVRKHIGL